MPRHALALAALPALTAAAPAAAAAPVAGAQTLTCAQPVRPGDTFASLRLRFGEAAVASAIGGPEGDDAEGVVLWPDDPVRRLELVLSDDAARTVAGVRIADASAWSAGGVRLGDGIAAVRRINGKPFALSGFDWDYGGTVTDLARGRLAVLPGGCTVSIAFEPAAVDDYPQGISGEVSLSSDDPRVRAVMPVVSQLTLQLAGTGPK